ncbi:MAG: hypothetical protein ACREA0_22045 [bacterium]
MGIVQTLRVAIDFEHALDEVGEPVFWDPVAGIQDPLGGTVVARVVSAISTSSTASLGWLVRKSRSLPGTIARSGFRCRACIQGQRRLDADDVAIAIHRAQGVLEEA